jgi:hypothetical protein
VTALLVALTALEAALAIAVLAVYLVLVDRHLRVISTDLGKISFGVRAVDSQTAPIGPSVLRVNATLAAIEEALGEIAQKAARIAAQRADQP